MTCVSHSRATKTAARDNASTIDDQLRMRNESTPFLHGQAAKEFHKIALSSTDSLVIELTAHNHAADVTEVVVTHCASLSVVGDRQYSE